MDYFESQIWNNYGQHFCENLDGRREVKLTFIESSAFIVSVANISFVPLLMILIILSL